MTALVNGMTPHLSTLGAADAAGAVPLPSEAL